MKVIFTFCFFMLSVSIMGQLPVPSRHAFADSSGEKPGTKIRIRCMATKYNASEPLLIIDGVVAEFKMIERINPNDVESIEVLKGAEVSAIYGCRASSGVIIITTKNLKTREFQIKDLFDESNVARATVTFVSTAGKIDTLMFTANDSGRVTANKLKAGKDYKLTISSAGYKTLSTVYKNIAPGENIFLLERHIVDCPPIKVASRTIRCSRIVYCQWHLISDCTLENSQSIAETKVAKMAKIYPNPAQRGGNVMIDISTGQPSLLYVKLVSLDGRQLLLQTQDAGKGILRVPVYIDSRWSAGVYFLQVLDDKKKLIKQEKLIIQ